MKPLIVQHERLVQPAAVGDWVQSRGHEARILRVNEGEVFPENLDFDGVIILGGAMGVYDKEDHPWIEKEEAWIRLLIQSEVPLLGICLGAQLIASALGAKVEPMLYREIGWKEIRFSEKALNHPLFEGLPKSMKLLSWHGDQSELPQDAICIGKSEACKNQGFILGSKTLALQFHPEANPELLEAFIPRYEKVFEKGGPHIQSPDQIQAEMENHKAMNELLYRWLDRLFALNSIR